MKWHFSYPFPTPPLLPSSHLNLTAQRVPSQLSGLYGCKTLQGLVSLLDVQRTCSNNHCNTAALCHYFRDFLKSETHWEGRENGFQKNITVKMVSKKPRKKKVGKNEVEIKDTKMKKTGAVEGQRKRKSPYRKALCQLSD